MVRVLGIGDNTVDIYVDQGVQFPGGNAVNIAVLTRRLGAKSAYLGCIGTDFLGGMIRDALVAEDIDISHLRVVRGPNSWSRIRHRGNDRFFDGSHPSLREDYQLQDVDFAYVAGFDLAHSSIYSRLEDELPRLHAAAPLLSFDYSSEYDDAYIARTAPHLDIAFLSDAGRDEEACRSLARLVASYGPSQVVITRGAEGALAFDGNEFLSQGIVAADVVDTLGAGDGFIAGFLMARLQDQPASAALVRGAECAAEVCSYRGAFGHEAPLRPGQPGLTKPQEEAGNGQACLANREEKP
jgi:fructoselysine 6-kinase